MEGVCAVNVYGSPSFHERCYCDSVSPADCENMCNDDELCKGYVIKKGSNQCQVATSAAECQPGCQKANIGNVGDLVIDSSFQGSTYEGCFIKGTCCISNITGIKVHRNCELQMSNT